MRYPVTKDPDNKTEVIELDLDEVIFVDSQDRFIVFHTIEGIYYPVLPKLSTLETQLGHLGFRRLDRTNLVNTNKIKHYDHERSLVFFDDSITKNSKYATISASEKSKLSDKPFGNADKALKGREL
ncbi:LytTR family transcriptional regulator DNA-binding domain-containing protein [Cohnella sp.]|uniref:LytTR family transcriptional regulator DNA-binding domain-containing protein n=1 Tax=Cohnella sp. TaxID=1883426 RepID=UPI0035630248